MNAQRTSAEETERTLRAESVLSDDRLPVKWDGEYIYWADTWTDTMPFLCGNNNLLKDQACPGTDERRRWKQYRPHLWRPRTINGRTTQSKLRLMRCGVCGLTLVEEHPLNAAAPSSKENSTSKKQSRLIPAERTEMIGMTRPKAKDRPRGKPFDEPERKYLCSLDIIDACTEKRITWNKTFIEYAEKELEAGSRPVDIFRGAGVGPELIGRKRIERCVARWRAKIKKEEQQ